MQRWRFLSLAMNGSRLRAWARLLGINLLVVLVGVIMIELALGRWFAPYHPPSGSIFRRTFKLQQQLYQPYGVVTYVRDEYGLRGSEKAVDKIEVASVGGSTTDQIFISEGETWQDVVHALTGIRITNAGDEGISSTGHLVAVVEWLHRIPDFHPRFYLHYIGLNDAAFAYAWTLPESKALVEAQIADQENRRALHRFIRGRSALVQGAIALQSWLTGPPKIFTAPPASPPGPGRPEFRAAVNEQPIMDYIRRIYEPNLRRLIAEHQNRNEEAIFVSQTMRPSLFRIEGNSVWGRDPAIAGYAMALRLVNAATEAVCRSAPTCHFIDLASEISFQDDEFYDNVHTTPAGARRIGAYLAEKLPSIVRAPSVSRAK